MVDLFYREMGEGSPIVMLHGLFGSSDNLGALSRGMSADYRVIAVDLRNHGRSPHAGEMDYQTMADDVARLMDKLNLSSAPVFGHSMGGKTAMQLALSHSDRVDRLIVADIAPVAYGARHGRILEGMEYVAQQAPTSRRDAQKLLSPFIEEPEVLTFLLTNWRRQENGSWGWRVNLNAIQTGYDDISSGNFADKPYQGQTLFLKGGDSDYILPTHREATLNLFPNAAVRTIEGTGHWLHAEKPAMVERLVRRFILDGRG